MSGEGKYTKYAPVANAKNILLNKLFRDPDPATAPVVQDLVGKEDDVRQRTLAIARANLTPPHQVGDLSLFPAGVDLNFVGGPQLTDVQWTRPGDPANPYTPDMSSPGPGKTDGVDKSVDPGVSAKEVKPNYIPAGPKTGTKSPSVTSAKIYAAALLGVPSKLGDSGGNT
jgi:hypothetical protein